MEVVGPAGDMWTRWWVLKELSHLWSRWGLVVGDSVLARLPGIGRAGDSRRGRR
jgi:hypothetical protein